MSLDRLIYEALRRGNIALAKFSDDIPLNFGSSKDVSVAWDGSTLNILPLTDDVGAIYIGNGTKDIDLKVFLGTSAKYVLLDVGNVLLRLEDVDLLLGDNDELRFGDGTGGDVVLKWDATNLTVKPTTDDTGAIVVGDGTLDMDLKIHLNATTKYALFDVGNSLFQLEDVDILLGDNDELRFGDGAGGDVVVKWDATNLTIKPRADDTGAIVIGDGTTDMDLKIFLSTTGKYVEFNMGDVKVNIIGTQLVVGTSAASPTEFTGTGTSNLVDVNSKLSAASGILRGIVSYAEFSGTNIGVATNLYAIRGYAKMSGTAAGSNTFYSAGVQGKLELSGTVSGGKHCAMLAQLNSSEGLTGATGGTVYALWVDGMQVSQTPAAALNMTALGIELPDAATRFDSAIYIYGGATYMFDIAGEGVGGSYAATWNQAPAAATGSLKCRVGSTDVYLLCTTDPTA